MPYIKQEDRPKMDKVVDAMVDAGVQANGDLNYILFALCKRCTNPSYNNYKNFLGEIHESAEEIRRRLLIPYENNKLITNGDVE